MNYFVLLFYKYVDISNPEKLRDEIFSFCGSNNIKGRILISEEGINGTASGKENHISLFKDFLKHYNIFSDLSFKEDKTDEHAFKKLFVRVKKEIVTSGLDTKPGKGVTRLRPEELKEFYDTGKDFLIVDVRNDYEAQIGRFKNAIIPGIENFREWKEAVNMLNEYKEKPIITYCTGGIRCEKASAYMVEQGFKNVFQLDGGIINYVKNFPDTYWEGSVFVFDERRLVEVNSNPELMHIASCYYCGMPSSYYINCHNQDCDKILITCNNCKIENEYCCSDQCRKSGNKRGRIHG